MIDKENFEKASFEENQKFIKLILRLVTHNAFTKDDLLLLIKWQNAIIEKMKCCGNCNNWYGCSKEKQMLFKLHKNCVDWELAEE
jgi:hypothetical protein